MLKTSFPLPGLRVRRRTAAITLMEILVGVAILFVLLAIAYPIYMRRSILLVLLLFPAALFAGKPWRPDAKTLMLQGWFFSRTGAEAVGTARVTSGWRGR